MIIIFGADICGDVDSMLAMLAIVSMSCFAFGLRWVCVGSACTRGIIIQQDDGGSPSWVLPRPLHTGHRIPVPNQPPEQMHP
jgi:hypothetical protein